MQGDFVYKCRKCGGFFKKYSAHPSDAPHILLAVMMGREVRAQELAQQRPPGLHELHHCTPLGADTVGVGDLVGIE